MRTLYSLILISFAFSWSAAQNITAESVDLQTYNAFIKQDYDTTIHLGKEALHNGIDFYFLRYRLGVAYYEKKRFEQAVTNLERAKAFDANDAVLLEYLYYAYLFSNRVEKANLLAETFSSDLKSKVKYAPKFFKSIGVEVGTLFTDNLNKFKKTDLLQGNPTAAGEFFSDVTYGNLYINNQISPRFKLQHVASLVSNMSTEINQEALPVPATQVYSNKNNYFQYNMIGSYFTHNWTLTAGWGYYYSTYSDYSETPTFSDTGVAKFPIKALKNYSGSIGLSKRLKYIEPSVSFSYSNLQQLKNCTYEGGLTYYPLGNVSLYGNSKVAFVSNENEKNTIYTQLLGFQLSKKIWCELFGATGNHTNYVADNGLIVYNTPNKINWYAGGNLNFYFNKFDLTLGYNTQERASTYTSGLNTVNYKYNYNLIKTKIVWKF